ncbi:hypothetical protein B9G55_06400 [Saccharibacillus sp. O16]|nr:hypothetical protein B9G55_06400 [Saccharibacillus sp. O16]
MNHTNTRLPFEDIQAIFLDRDGTLGGSDEMILPGAFTCFPSVPESIQAIKDAGKLIFSFTNQPVIARGQAVLDDFVQELTTWGFDGVYVCPHEHGEGCDCRKPNVGMLKQAAAEHQVNLRKCAVIGDRWTDLVAANRAGCMAILVQTGAGSSELERYHNGGFSEEWAAAYPAYTAKDLNEAINWMMNREEVRA